MIEQFKKIEKIIKIDAVKGLKMVAELVNLSKKLDPVQKKELNRWLLRMQDIFKKVFTQLYHAKNVISKDDLEILALGSRNLFNNGGMGVPAIKAIKESVKMLDEGKIDDAVKLVKKSARTVQYRAATLVNTLRLGLSRSDVFAGAKDDDLFEYVGSKFKVRPKCKKWLEKRYFTYMEIKGLNNGQGLPVTTFCGGYNCRHGWMKKIGSIN